MKFIQPPAEELKYLRADPLLWAQELDVRPDVAEAIERAAGIRAGQVYWRSAHDHLYSLELADLGRGRPSMARIYGWWDRYEPRPPEHEIDTDLQALMVWVAESVPSLKADDLQFTLQISRMRRTWAPGSVARTPVERFQNLPDYAYEPKFVEVEGLRIAYVEHGAGDPLLMLHGEPTWGYLYRRMIPTLSKSHRVIVPDLVGFGRSDKPVPTNAHSYKAHVRLMRGFVTALDLRRTSLGCQDWGWLIGLRALSQIPERFDHVVAMNTALPDGAPLSEAFMQWRRLSQRLESIDAGAMVGRALKKRQLTAAEAAAYSAPYPTVDHQTAALLFPRLVPIRPDHPGAYENRLAIERLRALDIPVLLPGADGDPITAAGEKQLRSIFRKAAPPLTIKGAGHFLQEDSGEEIAGLIARWLQTGSAV